MDFKYLKDENDARIYPVTHSNGVVSGKHSDKTLTQELDNYVLVEGSKNLLNPTMSTATQAGITCTNNGDGTYALNGTASATATFDILSFNSTEWNNLVAKGVKLVGCPSGGSLDTYVLYTNGSFGDANFCTNTNGVTISNTQSTSDVKVRIQVSSGQACNNLIFKPMITTDMSATYNDYQPYFKSNKVLTDRIDRDYELERFGYVCPIINGVRNFVDSNGVLHRRIARVDLTNFEWYAFTWWGSDHTFQASLSSAKSTSAEVYLQGYDSDDTLDFSNAILSGTVQGVGIRVLDDYTRIIISDSSCTTAEQMKAKLKGKYLYYELQTEETYSAYDTPSVQSMISDEWQSGTTYSVGSYCIDENVLYKCLVQNSGQKPKTSPTYWQKCKVTDELAQVDVRSGYQLFGGSNTVGVIGTNGFYMSVDRDNHIVFIYDNSWNVIGRISMS